MATDPVQFSLMMNNRPRAELDKAQQRNDEVFKQQMEAISMGQRAQQMADQRKQFDIVQQLRAKESEFNQKQSMAEAALAERRIGIAEKDLGFKEKEIARTLKREEDLKVFRDKLADIDVTSDDAISKIEGAMSGMDYETGNAAQALVIQKKKGVTESRIGQQKAIQDIAKKERYLKIHPRFSDGVNMDNEEQLRYAEMMTNEQNRADAAEASALRLQEKQAENDITTAGQIKVLESRDAAKIESLKLPEATKIRLTRQADALKKAEQVELDIAAESNKKGAIEAVREKFQKERDALFSPYENKEKTLSPEERPVYPTATNPKTGEKLIKKDGKWQPIP